MVQPSWAGRRKQPSEQAHLHESVPCSFDTEHFDDLHEVVADGAGVVHVRVAHHVEQVDALGVQNPLILRVVAAVALHIHQCALCFADEHLADALNSLHRDKDSLIVFAGDVFRMQWSEQTTEWLEKC